MLLAASEREKCAVSQFGRNVPVQDQDLSPAVSEGSIDGPSRDRVFLLSSIDRDRDDCRLVSHRSLDVQNFRVFNSQSTVHAVYGHGWCQFGAVRGNGVQFSDVCNYGQCNGVPGLRFGAQ